MKWIARKIGINKRQSLIALLAKQHSVGLEFKRISAEVNTWMREVPSIIDGWTIEIAGTIDILEFRLWHNTRPDANQDYADIYFTYAIDTHNLKYSTSSDFSKHQINQARRLLLKYMKQKINTKVKG